ncbi:MAG: hypothetical protein OJJ55_19145 [Rhodococcus sp.]|nr:hypothetical protein [Rhodococcus sp. (in: high G+C Gram-positive bacteria)]
MADGTVLNPGTGGDTIYTDDIASGSAAGTKVQGVKLGTGANGSWTEVGTANPIPVSDAGGSLTVDGTVVVSGTVTVDSELPAAAALADNASNPTAPAVGAFEMLWDGTTWDRAPGTAADGQLVNLGANNDVTVTGTVTANLSATDNAVLDAIEADTTTIAGAVAGTEMQVDIVSAPTLTADTELTTADLDTGAGTDTRAVVGIAGTASGGAQLIPGSSTDGLLVNLGANNDVTVSGVATAANQATVIGHVDGIEALLTTIDADTGGILTAVQTLDNAIAGSEMQVDVITMPTVTVDSELPAAAALGDNTANPTAPAVGAFELLWDGTTWDRAPGTSADGALVNLGANNDVTVTSGTITLGAGSAAVGKLAANSGVDIGDVDVTSIAAGANAIGNVGVIPRTSGGYTIFRSIDLDETEEEIKASAGQVFGWYIFNAAASTRYVKFYNATAASVTVGTTTPVLTIPIPAGAAANVFSETGIAFGTAISAAATTGVADSDVGAPAANDVVINVFYA